MQLLNRSIALFLIIALSACSSSTLIETIPPGAKVFMNGEYVGDTPYQHSDKKIVLSKTIMELEKPGFQPRRVILSKDEEPNIGAILGGILYNKSDWG